VPLGVLSQQAQVRMAVATLEKHIPAVISALSYVVRYAREDATSMSRHEGKIGGYPLAR
jgi:hypothetical protein